MNSIHDHHLKLQVSTYRCQAGNGQMLADYSSLLLVVAPHCHISDDYDLYCLLLHYHLSLDIWRWKEKAPRETTTRPVVVDRPLLFLGYHSLLLTVWRRENERFHTRDECVDWKFEVEAGSGRSRRVPWLIRRGERSGGRWDFAPQGPRMCLRNTPRVLSL